MGRSKKVRRDVERAETRQNEQFQAQFLAAQISYWSGPTPSPDVLRQFEELVPGSADRIIAMAERQSEHRQRLEARAVKGGDRRATLGSIFGFVIGMTAILGGLYLATRGQELGGYALMLGTIVALTSVFVYGRKSAKRELAQKSPGQQVAKRE
ncbi:MAG: DUF2335 domain-containing protein [Gemmatimonadota bacterium]